MKSKNIIFGISTKLDGSMKLLADENDKKILANRKKYFKKLKINLNNVVWADLAGDSIKAVNRKDRGKIIKRVNGLITDEKNLYLAITVADCLPVYFYDKNFNIIGLVHLGWREIVKNIAKKIVNLMKREYKTEVKNIFVFVGPHIKKCHFEIKKDVLKKFNKFKNFIAIRRGRMFVDLSGILKKQLLSYGLKNNRIRISSQCTYCLENKYFSYRRDRSYKIKAMTTYIGIK